MKKILIVDDHPSIRLALRLQLENIIGIDEIVEADNGKTALELTRTTVFDLMIVDLDIPHINGLDLIARIRSTQPKTKLLVLSGQDEAVYAGRVKQAGAHGFVSKRLEIADIIRTTEMVLAGYVCFPDSMTDASRRGHQINDATSGRILTNKELAILSHLAGGLSNKQIADILFISNKTVSTHKTRIMTKLNVVSLVELVDYARRNNITVTPE